jgi:archaemetzincin
MKYLYMGATADLRSDADREAVPAAGDYLAREFGLPMRSIELPSIDFSFDPGRAQYASIPVLETLLRLCPADAAKLLAVTSRDLFIPVLTFVFGHAQLGGRAAVVSLARLHQAFYGLPPDREIFLARAAKEALHEAGHTFGLVHCADRSCAMSLSTGVRQIDSKQAAFCAPCAARARRAASSSAARSGPQPLTPDPRPL